ncbi:MAG: chitobiase/beta-hexosaminidase C-terminal domain-containing protein [Bacteroidales bacterium]|nr:chitobiase/beta-hexosaminidase C-terminal domain-containing protein [Bacteroidales bacterium]
MKKKFTFLIMALFALIASPGRAEVVSGTTYETKSTSSLPNGWTGNGGGTSYIQLTSSSNHITTDNFIQNGFTSIVLKARKYGGPSDAQALITVSWYDAATSNETVLGTIVPTNTTLTNCTISSPTNPTGNTSGYIKIQCKGASSGKGSGVSEVTISYTAGSSTDPSITVNPTTITWNDSPINEELSKTISVSQANLTEGITISSTIGTVTPSTIAAGEDATDVTFTYTPTSVDDFEGEITFTSGETTAIVSVTGSAYDPSQVVTYEKVTSVNDLVAGASYILVCPTKNKAAGAMGSNAYFSSKDATLTDNTVTSDDAIELVLGGTTGAWTFTTSEGLIGTTEVKKLNHTGEGTTTWTIVITSGKATITSTNTNYGSIKYNASSPRFLNYASGQTDVALYKKAENKAATPTLTESQTFTTKPFEVTITNNEAGAKVYYTTNGDDPTTETTTNFTGASTTININATTTVKAMAVVEGKANSDIASATYTEQKTDPENQWSAETYTATIGGENTFPEFYTQSDGAVTYTSSNTNAATIDATGTITLVAAGTTTITASTAETASYMAGEASYTLTVKEAPLTTMDAIFEKATTVGSTATEVEVTFNNWVISGVKNSNAYLTDNNGKGLIIYTSNHGFKIGNVLSGTVTCKVQLYNGSAELTNLTATTSGLTVTTGGTITPTEVSIADLSGVNTGAVIIASNVIYTGSDNVFSDGENTIKAYYTFMTLPSFTNGDRYNLTGVYIQYNNTKEIAPRSGDDIVLIVAAPTFTPEGGNYNAAQTVEITSATAGAAIYYTLDGSDPTVESTLYSAPIELTSNTTLKAIAAKAGSVSEIATAVYTITITTVATPTFKPEGGSYFNESLAVSLDCATDGATIVYTTDDWATSTNYTASFTITETTTVKAKATKAGMDDSGIAEATYTKRYKVNFVVNGDGSLFEPTYVTPSSAIGTLPTPEVEYIPTGFGFAGWSNSESSTTTIGETYIVDADVTLYAVFSRVEGGTQGSGNYEKVTEDLDDWSGTYLMAATNSTSSYAFNNIIASDWGKFAEITISDNTITKTQTTDSYEITIGETSTHGNYYLQISNGNYLSASAKTKFNTSETQNNNTSFNFILNDDGKIEITSTSNSSRTIQFNYNGGNGGFRFYDDGTQIIPDLYKKDEGIPGTLHYYTRVFLNETAEANITISGPSIIPVNSTLNMGEYELTNETAANLIIEDGAQLILNEKNIGVMATVKKQIEASNTHTGEPVDKWYTIGSPVKEPIINGSTGNYVADIIPAGCMSALTYDLYYLDMTAGTWINYRQEGGTPGFTTLENGRGYIYSNQSATTVKYVGELNTAKVNRSVNTGWNLVSNPFAQTIAFSNFELDNSVSMVGYYSLDGAGGWQAEPITTVVASNTGILVNVPEGASSIKISKPAEAIENNGAKRGDSNDNAYAYIEINVANANYSDRAYAAFAEGYGLPKYDHINAEIQKVYIPQDGEDFAIAMMDENVTLFPVSFKAMTTGYYTISLKSSQIYEGYNDFDYLHLIDNMTGEEIDMLMEDGYKFAASPKDNAGRFTVKLHRNGIEENDVEVSNFVYQYGNELVIDGEGALQVFDVLGRVVISEEVHGQRVDISNLNTGAYIVRMIGNEVKTQKIVIK